MSALGAARCGPVRSFRRHPLTRCMLLLSPISRVSPVSTTTMLFTLISDQSLVTVYNIVAAVQWQNFALAMNCPSHPARIVSRHPNPHIVPTGLHGHDRHPVRPSMTA